MENTEKKPLIPCPDKRANCAAYAEGFCIALEDANFGGRSCLFFKNREQADAKWVDAVQRLIELGENDKAVRLIKKGWMNEWVSAN